jgi:heme-degrading monooxygenase HmoA/uncharacterized damage-inducible protein DinB
MIARSWDGLVESRHADEYSDYVRRTGVVDLQATEGNRGVWLLRRREGERVRMRVVSLWDSLDAIRRFAGSPPERARYYPEDAKFLLRLEPEVEHFEVAASASPEAGRDEVAALADAVRRIGEGDTWHGPSLAELLADVHAPRALARPLPAAHSIFEIVLHVAAWTDVFRRRLQGTAVEEPEAGDFPPVSDPTDAGWDAARTRLRRGHTELLDVVAGLDPGRLGAAVPGRPFSVRFQVQSAIRHVVYHSGQIGLLRKAGPASP